MASSTDGQIISTINTMKSSSICTHIYIYAKKNPKRKKRKKNARGLYTIVYIEEEEGKEKKSKGKDVLLFCFARRRPPRKRHFLNLPLVDKKRKERTRNLACTRTTMKRKKENEDIREEMKKTNEKKKKKERSQKQNDRQEKTTDKTTRISSKYPNGSIRIFLFLE